MRRLIIGFYVFYVLIVTYFSLTPIEHKISESIWDKAAHFISYLFLVMIVKKVHIRFNYLTCVVICCSYSFVIECIQYFIPNRMFDVLDMLANVLGTILGIIIYYLIIEKCFNKCRGVAAKVVNK
ncbi:MAG: VanZ family protein [Candidatus Brocadiales bacterium]|nr:VanZ family protein [Candidatus Brocadiales bacterium]